MHFFSPCKYIDSNGNILRTTQNCTGKTILLNGEEYVRQYVFTPGHIHRCPGVVTHRKIFEKCKYRESAGHIADDDFFYRVGNYTDVVGILKPLACYREHNNSETGHISDLELCVRLLKDYNELLVQSKFNKLITSDVYNAFCKYRRRYEHRVIIFSLRLKKFDITFWCLKLLIKRFFKSLLSRLEIFRSE